MMATKLKKCQRAPGHFTCLYVSVQLCNPEDNISELHITHGIDNELRGNSCFTARASDEMTQVVL